MNATTKDIQRWIREIEKRKKAVAAERDNLDALINDLVELKECCERADDSLQDARDALSELV